MHKLSLDTAPMFKDCNCRRTIMKKIRVGLFVRLQFQAQNGSQVFWATLVHML